MLRIIFVLFLILILSKGLYFIYDVMRDQKSKKFLEINNQ